jgi:hypothetical protein
MWQNARLAGRCDIQWTRLTPTSRTRSPIAAACRLSAAFVIVPQTAFCYLYSVPRAQSLAWARNGKAPRTVAPAQSFTVLQDPPADPLISVADAARQATRSPRSFRRYVDAGLLGAVTWRRGRSFVGGQLSTRFCKSTRAHRSNCRQSRERATGQMALESVMY